MIDQWIIDYEFRWIRNAVDGLKNHIEAFNAGEDVDAAFRRLDSRITTAMEMFREDPAVRANAQSVCAANKKEKKNALGS